MTRWLFPVLIAAFFACAVAFLGATITDIGPWYRSLILPRWAPPDAVYGIGWTIIYAFTALAAVTGWHATATQQEANRLIGLFALNGFFNILWSLLFFRFHRPDWALVEVLLLWLSVGSLILVTWPRSIAAALMLVPYICWVTFAGYLNMTIVRLNGPFG